MASVLYGSLPLLAQPPATSADVHREAIDEVAEAAGAFHRVMDARTIPADLLRRAEAVGVFSNVVSAAFLVGGRGGDGVIARRSKDGWGAPAFFKLGAASLGAQIGGTKTDLVLVFMTRKAVDALLDDRLEVGSEVVAVAGTDEALATEPSGSMRQDLVIYSRHEGVFAGAAVNGAVVTPDNDLNRRTYDRTAREILSGVSPTLPVPDLGLLGNALSKFKPTTSS